MEEESLEERVSNMQFEKLQTKQELIGDQVTDIQIKMNNHLTDEHVKLGNRLDTIDSALSGLKKKLGEFKPATSKFVALITFLGTLIYLIIFIYSRG